VSIVGNQAENSQQDSGISGLPENRLSGAGFLIIGSKGQLGLALQAQYPDAKAVDSDELDITDREAVQNFDWSNITHILNAAAYTNVDGAETPEGRVAAWAVNATAVSHLACVSNKHDIILLHISSDYVFNGTNNNHTEDESMSPLSVYGASKAAGDLACSTTPKHYLLRTSWVIGEGKNFVRTMISLADRNISPTVVHDQVGRLTFTSELVRAINYLLSTGQPYGTYNISNSGDSASWADIARTIFGELNRNDLTVSNTTTAEYFEGKEGIAPRPLQSTLSLSKIELTGFQPTDWQQDLKAYMEKEKKSS
jgi:dTDP-4-dehydrorhamnose 3,5-epimerase